MRFVVSIVTCTIVEAIVTPTMGDTVRVGWANVMIGTPGKRSCFLKNGECEGIVLCMSKLFPLLHQFYKEKKIDNLPGQRCRPPMQQIASTRRKGR